MILDSKAAGSNVLHTDWTSHVLSELVKTSASLVDKSYSTSQHSFERKTQQISHRPLQNIVLKTKIALN